MAYKPTIWQTGDIVSSEKLNKLENRIAGAGVKILMFDQTENHGFVKSVDTYYSFDEIKDMLAEYSDQILVCLTANSNGVFMPTTPIFVSAGTQCPISIGGTPSVDTIYLGFFGYDFGKGQIALLVFECTQSRTTAFRSFFEISTPSQSDTETP